MHVENILHDDCNDLYYPEVRQSFRDQMCRELLRKSLSNEQMEIFILHHITLDVHGQLQNTRYDELIYMEIWLRLQVWRTRAVQISSLTKLRNFFLKKKGINAQNTVIYCNLTTNVVHCISNK